ncbi:MAG: hypothetical protein KW788_03810 [Candidatus Doudnabacteria bacterium]|nr:hypothetical protein [Candidatus Doudnabacteria bacterium]
MYSHANSGGQMPELVANHEELAKKVRYLGEGQSQTFMLPWSPTKQDLRALELRLARLFSGSTLKIEKTGPTEVNITHCAAARGFTITGGGSGDLKYLESPYHRRRI